MIYNDSHDGRATPDKIRMLMTGKQMSEIGNAAKQRIVAHRQQRVLALYTAGMKREDIAAQLKISERTVYRDLRVIDHERLEVDAMIQDVGVDAEDLHLIVTQMLDADLADLYDKDGNVLPVRSWPPIWRRGMAVEITEEIMSERSDDGVQAGKSKAWDAAGIRRKIKVYSRDKLMEFAAKLKAVDALASDRMEVEVRDVTYRWEGDEEPPSAKEIAK